MENRRSITSKDIQNAILGETKRLLEIMEESKGKVSNLQQDLKHNEDIFEQLENSIRNRKDTSNNNITVIESNETFKYNVKEFNRKFLTSAQLIYSCGQEIFKEQNIRESELCKLEGIIGKTEETYNFRVQHYETEEKKLMKQLQEFEKQDLENEAKVQENRDLNSELQYINKEIEYHQKQNAEKEHISIQQKTLYETEIETLKEKIALADDELSCTHTSLKDTNKRKADKKASLSESLVNIEKMIQEGQTELATKNIRIEELINHRNDNNNKLVETESSVDQLEAEIMQMDIKLKDLESRLTSVEKNYINEIDEHQSSIALHEKKLTDGKQLHLKLSEELSTCKVRIDKLLEEVEDLKKYIDDLEGRPKIDLNQQLEEKQIVMNEVKIMKQHCKEQLKTLTTEQQEQIKKEQEEIVSVEKSIKDLEKDISAAEAEINNLSTEEELKIVENSELEKQLMELESEIETLKEAVTAKNEDVHFMHPKVSESQVVKTKTVPKNLPSKPRNWDSDSSIEGEDRSYSERARLKIRLMKKATQ